MPTDGGRVRVGVIGVGSMGRHHARLYAASDVADLVGVCDLDPERGRAVAAEFGARAYESVYELLSAVDAVSVAVPTNVHEPVAVACLAAGCDVLLEKPMAVDLPAAERILATSREHERILQIGHVERFNPAVRALIPRVKRPGFIEIHRLGSFAPRGLEVDVVLDLMIHDIEIVHALVPGELLEVHAAGATVLSDEVDIANARLSFASGCTVNMTASRVSMNRVRKLRVFQPSMYLSVDYSAQQVSSFRLDRDEQGRPTIEAVPVEVVSAEPLAEQLQDFLRCVVSRAAPVVDGATAHRALRTALRIRDALRSTLASVGIDAPKKPTDSAL